MFDRILLVTDLSAESAAAWDIAIELVQRAGRAELPVLHLGGPPAAYAQVEAPRVAEMLLDDDRRAADEAMRRYVDACSNRGVHVRPIVRLGPSLASIASTAQGEAADLIVLGIRPAGAISRLLGSSVAELARLSPCHVLYVKLSKSKS